MKHYCRWRDYLFLEVSGTPGRGPTVDNTESGHRAGRESPHEVFERLLREHGRSLVRLAAVYERDPDAQQDLLQEIAFALWRALPSFRGESSERTFLFRIAHNRAITHQSRARAWLGRWRSDEAISHVADPKPDTLVTLLTAERRRQLTETVRKLSPALREAVALSLEGLSHREIAEVLGTTERTVAVRLSRARAALASVLVEPDAVSPESGHE